MGDVMPTGGDGPVIACGVATGDTPLSFGVLDVGVAARDRGNHSSKPADRELFGGMTVSPHVSRKDEDEEYVATDMLVSGASGEDMQSFDDADEPLSTSRESTYIILDWDDTLLSSTFLASIGLRIDCEVDDIPLHVGDALFKLETAVIALLKKALKLGRTVIITNSETGWVELSARKFLPRVLPLLSRIQVHSARSTFESAHPSEPCKWKYLAMLRVFNEELNSQARRERHFLSFGDSLTERQALHMATQSMSKALCKSIKFVDRPNIEQLTVQVTLVHEVIDKLCVHRDHLDLMLSLADSTTMSPPS